MRLNRRALFKGRRELRDAVVNALLERNRPTLVLHGPRRMGKTSFLLQLPALLPGRTVPVFVDLQRPAARGSTAGFLYYLARAISQAARPYRLLIQPPQQERFEADPFEAFESWLEETALPQLDDFNLLLAFDEFEKLGEALTRPQGVERALLDELRHLIQHQSQLAFLFAGVQTLDELGPDWSSYFINVKPLPIGYLRPDEAKALIIEPDPGANFSLSYAEEVVGQILALTHCHPYLVQLVCSALVEEANAARVNFVDPALLEQGLVRALDQGAPYFRNVWDEMAGPAGQGALRQIAAAGQPLTFHEADPQTQAALARMVRHRVLSRGAEGYSVEVPLVGRWVLERGPIAGEN